MRLVALIRSYRDGLPVLVLTRRRQTHMLTEHEWYGTQQGGRVQPFQSNLRRLRELRGLTQEQLAHRAELTLGGYRKIECGANSNPRLRTMERLAYVLGVKVAELL
jgi:DNA-binding XRE family transcriptional regulator